MLKENMVSIYPNPSNGKLVVSAAINTDLEITDLNGRVVKQLQLNSTETEVELVMEQSGVYLLKFMKDCKFAVKRMIVQ